MDKRKKNQKVLMPASIRRKLMAATSMLVVAAIMLVSTSYAWFTLSTAPEVTGITTSVGANGNLEIALLNSTTYNDPGLITSNTGDSMANQSADKANITWGNLVDLSNSEIYGLDKIQLYPAALNVTEGVLAKDIPLRTPAYGADGRVNTVNANTVTAVYSGTAFTVDTANPSYGVRAVGVSSNISARQIAFNSAKSSVQSLGNNAEKPMRSAVADEDNMMALLNLALSVTGNTLPDAYDYPELVAMKSIAEGVQKSLGNIVGTYANAIIAKAASETTLTDQEVSVLSTLLSGVTSAETLKELATANSVTVDSTLVLDDLVAAQTAVAGAIAAANTLLDGKTDVADIDEYTGDAANTINESVIAPLLGENLDHEFRGANNETVSAGSMGELIEKVKFVYLTGGAAATVADYTGKVEVANTMGVAVYIGSTTDNDVLEGVVSTVAALTASGAASAASNITEYYGYIIDFAFRTNAADSRLQLQTSAVNRVYTNEDGANLATQGEGSTVTFDYSDELTKTQAENLLKAIRIAFFNPETGALYKTAAIGTVSTDESTGISTGEIYIISNEEIDYVLGKEAFDVVYDTDGKTVLKYALKSGYKYNSVNITEDNSSNYAAEKSIEEYNALAPLTKKVVTTHLDGDASAIASLPQSQAMKISAMVYLDGEQIDNGAVASEASSGSLKLNLQFSSSATLTPMENTTLKNMEKAAASPAPSASPAP